MTEQRRERLRVCWVHAGPVAGLLVYLAASGVHALAPVTSMVTAVQVLWVLFGVGMFLHALWGTEERSWIPRAGGLIVGVGLIAAWEIHVRFQLEAEGNRRLYLPGRQSAFGRVFSFVLMWAVARGLQARRGSFLLAWLIGWGLAWLGLEYSGDCGLIGVRAYRSYMPWNSVPTLIRPVLLWGVALLFAVVVLDCVLHHLARPEEGARSGDRGRFLHLPLLLLGGSIWISNENVAEEFIYSWPEAAKVLGGNRVSWTLPKEVFSLAALCLGLIGASVFLTPGRRWRGLSGGFLFGVGAAAAVFVYTLHLSLDSSRLPLEVAVLIAGLVALFADQPRPGRGFAPSSDSRQCARSFVDHLFSPLAAWRLKGQLRHGWVVGPVGVIALTVGIYLITTVANGRLNPYGLSNLMENRERMGEFLGMVATAIVYLMVMLAGPVAVWFLCQRLAAQWGAGPLEQLRVTPLRNWDLWWAIVVPPVRAYVVLMLQGILFSICLAVIAQWLRTPGIPESKDDSGLGYILLLGPTAALLGGALAIAMARRTGVKGPLLFALVAFAFFMVCGLLIGLILLAQHCETVVGVYLPLSIAAFALMSLPYFALHGVPRDIDALFDESGRA